MSSRDAQHIFDFLIPRPKPLIIHRSSFKKVSFVKGVALLLCILFFGVFYGT